MNSLPRRPNFVLAWIVVVVAAFSFLTDAVLSPQDSEAADRIASSRVGARLEQPANSSAADRESPLASPAGRNLRGPAGSPIFPVGWDLPPTLNPDLLGESGMLPLASDKQFPIVGGEGTPSANENQEVSGEELPGATALVPLPPTPVSSGQPDFHRWNPAPYQLEQGVASSAIHGHQNQGFQDGRQQESGRTAWKEHMQLRKMPNGRISLLIRLEGHFGNRSAGQWASNFLASHQGDGEENPESDERAGDKKRQLVQAVQPLLPALRRAAVRAEQTSAEFGNQEQLRAKMKSWLRQRPGGVELVAELDLPALERLASELGPRYPQLLALLAAAR